MKYRILGELSVSTGDSPLYLPGSREQRVLAALLLSAGKIVPAHRLIDAVWGEPAPAAADKQLRNVVYRLRRLLVPVSGPQVVTTGAGGYRIRVAAGELDLAVFEEAEAAAQREAAQGRLAPAAETLAGALALWRGPALDGLDGSMFEAAATAWNQRRLTAQAIYAAHLLCLGKPEQVAADLGELVAQHPLREDLIALLMTALYRGGRQAEALALYDRTRTRLVQETGMDPGPALRTVHQQILTEAPDLAAPMPPVRSRSNQLPDPPRIGGATDRPPAHRPFQLPPAVPDFLGRRIEYNRLNALAATVAAGSALVVLTGLAGVGKSALAFHWAHRNEALYPDGILVADLHGFDPAGEPADPAHVLEGLLRSLGVAAEGIPRTLDERSALMRTCMAGRRILLILDNAARADQVRPLLAGSPGCLVLITSRDALSGLIVRDGATRLAVEPFADEDSWELLATAVGRGRLAADSKAAKQIVRGCAGLPLAVRIAAEQLARQPDTPLSLLAGRLSEAPSALDFLAIDGDHAATVRSVFSWSYDTLHAERARTLRSISLLTGTDVCAPAVAALCGTSPRKAAAALAGLADVSLLTSGGGGRYRMHDLVRAFAADVARTTDETETQCAAVDRLTAWYAQTAAAADNLLMPRRPNVEPGDPPPGCAALELSSYDEAIAWCESERANFAPIVRNALRYGHYDRAWRLISLLSGFYLQTKYWSDWESLCRLGLEGARAMADRAGEAQITNFLGIICGQTRRYREAVDHFTRVARLRRELDDRNGEAGALANLSAVEHLLGNYKEALALLAGVRDIHREHGSAYEEAITLTNMGAACIELGQHGQALEHIGTAVVMLRDLKNNYALGMTLDTLGKLLQAMDQPDKALIHHREALSIFRQTGDEYNEAGTLHLIGAALLKAGETIQARRALSASLALFDRIGAGDADEASEVRSMVADL